MIVSKTTYRTPTVLSNAEITKCKNYIESCILKMYKKGYKQFYIKDMFGFEQWDWKQWHHDLQCIYDAWCRKYAKTHPEWTNDEIWCEAYKQSAISLGHLAKQVFRDIPNINFKIDNPSGWNLVYTGV